MRRFAGRLSWRHWYKAEQKEKGEDEECPSKHRDCYLSFIKLITRDTSSTSKSLGPVDILLHPADSNSINFQRPNLYAFIFVRCAVQIDRNRFVSSSFFWSIESSSLNREKGGELRFCYHREHQSQRHCLSAFQFRSSSDSIRGMLIDRFTIEKNTEPLDLCLSSLSIR